MKSSTTDEFGGYSKPMPNNDVLIELEDLKEDECLCELVGIDIDSKLQELLKKI